MKNYIYTISIALVLFSCKSTMSFQSFFNTHKNDVGVTAFQVPNFMKALLGNISADMGGVFKNVEDFKFLTFGAITEEEKATLIQQVNLVTNTDYTDILRKNSLEKTKVIAVIENGDRVSEAIIFNTTLAKSAVFYLKGDFDPNTLKKISETDLFESLPAKLLQHNFLPASNTGFNPNN